MPTRASTNVKGGISATATLMNKKDGPQSEARRRSRRKFFIGDEVMDAKQLEKWLEPDRDDEASFYSEFSETYEPLSKREMEVLGQLTKGMSNKEIATSLGISHQTVKNHVTSILRKLDVDDRTQATLYALRRGWVRLQDDDKEIQE